MSRTTYTTSRIALHVMLRHGLLLAIGLLIASPALGQTNNYKAGVGAGESLTTGDFITAVGDSAAASLTSGLWVSALGFGAGRWNNQTENSFFGYQAGYNQGADSDLIVLGMRAGFANDGSDNTFIGTEAGLANTRGFDNTYVGRQAGWATTTGNENTFIGQQAGRSTTDADESTLIGSRAGFSLTTSNSNTAVGTDALYHFVAHREEQSQVGANTALGDSAGFGLTDGSLNTFVGQAAGAQAKRMSRSTLVGARAGFNFGVDNVIGSGDGNTMVGYEAGANNRSGAYNVGLGAGADFLQNFTPSNRNVFIGAQSIVRNFQNVALGYDSRSTGNQTLVVGSGARASTFTSVVIGYQSTYQGNGSNSLLIGGSSSLSNSSHAVFGNSATTAIGGVVNWTATSDARFKTDVTEDVPGLSFIRRLRPVQYRFRADALQALTTGDHLTDAIHAKAQRWETGFLAQEVAAAAEAEGFDFSGVVTPTADEPFALRYAEFVVPLTKAVQELDAKRSALHDHLAALRHQINAREDALAREDADLDALEALLLDYHALLDHLEAPATHPVAALATAPNP